jgi:ferredoxin-NADP reductase
VARAAVLGRLTWQAGTVAAIRSETPTARTLVLDVPGWPGHLAGQHVDVRLTAADGYQAARSYSLASAGDDVEVTVQLVPGGEVSSWLAGEARPGDEVEVRGPLGGWFVWRPEQLEPVQLVAGGSGIVPLASMVRSRVLARSAVPFRLLYSVRDPESVFYGDELRALAVMDSGFGFDPVFTRVAPEGSARPAGRLNRAVLQELSFGADRTPTCYVCGPTGFVEQVTGLLTALGHDPGRIRAERFGPAGGGPA